MQVLPAWRPDKAMGIEKPAFAEYMKTLGSVSQMEIQTFADLKKGAGA